jgi:Ca2+-binding RTX toxin-like protein
MATYVTVPGANHTQIVNPYSNTFNTQVAQAISTALFAAQNGGTLVVSNPPPATTNPLSAGQVGEISVTTPGGSYIYVSVPSGYTFTAIDQAVTGPVYISGGGSLFAGDQKITYTGSAASGTVSIAAGNGNDYFSLASGSTYDVGLGNGNDTVVASGTGTIVGGTGANYYNLGNATSTQLSSNSASDTIVSGSGKLVYLGGTPGAPTITGATGSGSATLYGSSGQDIHYLDNPNGISTGGNFLAAGAGNETLDASGASGAVGLAAGPGNSDLIGSTGPDTFYGGLGNSTMTANSNGDVFMFGSVAGGHPGATDIITDFNQSDTFITSGYGSNAAATAFANAAVTGSGSTLVSTVSLSDGTKIEFLGINTTTGTYTTKSF